MEVTFMNPGADYMIRQVMEFQKEGETAFWSNSLYHFFPQLDQDYAASLPFAERKRYMDSILRKVYLELENTINKKTVSYSQHWSNCRVQINEALSEAFEVDCSNLFNDLRCNVSINPVMPRFLAEHSFDVFYLNSERGAIGASIHEIIHFVWFYVWNKLFRDRYEEYERPSLK